MAYAQAMSLSLGVKTMRAFQYFPTTGDPNARKTWGTGNHDHKSRRNDVHVILLLAALSLFHSVASLHHSRFPADFLFGTGFFSSPAPLVMESGGSPPNRCFHWLANCTAGYSSIEPYVVTHHLILAHAAAVKVYREKYQSFVSNFYGTAFLVIYGMVIMGILLELEAAPTPSQLRSEAFAIINSGWWNRSQSNPYSICSWDGIACNDAGSITGITYPWTSLQC
ncbi:inactive beta-glucosidase 33 [Spatholobus suberectus]|nr:inactive beta-glucosidase 33 [Spatholobus suberectus]